MSVQVLYDSQVSLYILVVCTVDYVLVLPYILFTTASLHHPFSYHSF